MIAYGFIQMYDILLSFKYDIISIEKILRIKSLIVKI